MYLSFSELTFLKIFLRTQNLVQECWPQWHHDPFLAQSHLELCFSKGNVIALQMIKFLMLFSIEVQ